MFVKPAKGIKVRDPHTRQHLPAAGREVPEDSFWLRRLADGDVVRAELPRTEAATPKAADKAKDQ